MSGVPPGPWNQPGQPGQSVPGMPQPMKPGSTNPYMPGPVPGAPRPMGFPGGPLPGGPPGMPLPGGMPLPPAPPGQMRPPGSSGGGAPGPMNGMAPPPFPAPLPGASRPQMPGGLPGVAPPGMPQMSAGGNAFGAAQGGPRPIMMPPPPGGMGGLPGPGFMAAPPGTNGVGPAPPPPPGGFAAGGLGGGPAGPFPGPGGMPLAGPGYGPPPPGMPGGFAGGPSMSGMGAPGMGMGPPGMMGPGKAMGAPGYDGYGGQALMEHFESLSLGAGMPGQPEGVDLAALPRPIGAQQQAALAAQPVSDPGNCSPDNMRMTVNAIPATTALRSRWALPFGAVVHPMADEALGREVPVVNLGSAGIVRCRRCRTYMNPFVTWTDAGRRFKCNVCAQLNETPPEYFSSLDHNGRRQDAEQRPELALGTVEYVAPAEYMVRPPMPPVFFFVLDVSQAAVSSGMVATAAAAIKSCLASLPGDERTLVGFLTYDSTLHFYNLKASLTQPQMMVVVELDDPFVPLPDDLLVNLREAAPVIEALLDALPNTFSATTSVESAMGPALQAAFLVTSHIGGKLLLFTAAVASLGVGKVKNRETVAAYNTEREPALRNPEDAFYKRFAAECSRVQLTVDVFAFSAQYSDLASLAAIPRYTCGELYYYPSFNATRDGPKLSAEIVHNLTRPTAWEAVMRIRCSKGLRISSFHGHFFNRSSDLLALPTCDPDKAFAVQIAHEESVVTTPVGYVQCALLYTNSTGERRIRVHTMSVPVVNELVDMYKAADGAALACLVAKLAVEKSLASRLDETRTAVTSKVTGVLKEFRLMHASAVRQPNKLIYPENLKYLPLWALGIIKSAALRGGAKDVNADERIAVGHEIMAAPVYALCRLAYPTLYVLHDPSGPWGLVEPTRDINTVLPPSTFLSVAGLLDSGAYLLDNGRIFVMWIGRLLSPQWCTEVFGVDPSSPGSEAVVLSAEPVRDTPMSRRVNNVLAALRAHRPVHQQCFVVRQGSLMEGHVMPYFVEDRSATAPSYSDYMMALHKGVLAK